MYRNVDTPIRLPSLRFPSGACAAPAGGGPRRPAPLLTPGCAPQCLGGDGADGGTKPWENLGKPWENGGFMGFDGI